MIINAMFFTFAFFTLVFIWPHLAAENKKGPDE